MSSGARMRQCLVIGFFYSPLTLQQWGIPDFRRGRERGSSEAESCWHKVCEAWYRRMRLLGILEFVGNVTL
jgi:hypothetical protein